jgi:hypothetical protein
MTMNYIESGHKNKYLIPFLIVVSASFFGGGNATAAIDLQADLNRIVSGINQFDANSANASSVRTTSDVKRIFSNNAIILREISAANAAFKRDLNSAKKYISSRDTKDSPAFGTLIGLTAGYEVWLKYQNKNQVASQKCIDRAGTSFSAFSACSIALLPKTMENERLGRLKLESAWSAWKQWQIKFGHA